MVQVSNQRAQPNIQNRESLNNCQQSIQMAFHLKPSKAIDSIPSFLKDTFSSCESLSGELPKLIWRAAKAYMETYQSLSGELPNLICVRARLRLTNSSQLKLELGLSWAWQYSHKTSINCLHYCQTGGSRGTWLLHLEYHQIYLKLSIPRYSKRAFAPLIWRLEMKQLCCAW